MVVKGLSWRKGQTRPYRVVMVSTGRNRSMIDVAGRYKTEKSARQAVVDLERLWSRHTPEGMTTEFLVDTPEHEERR